MEKITIGFLNIFLPIKKGYIDAQYWNTRYARAYVFTWNGDQSADLTSRGICNHFKG